jgi:hypothetical protein
MGSLESNDLGTREFTLTKKSGVNTNVALQNFMTQYLSDSPHFSDESNAKEEAFRRYKRVISLTNDYFKSNIFLGENFPAKWSDIASCKQHEYILERVLFYSDRDISPRLPLTCDQYDEIHNHLIPIHLMQNKNGARLLLTDALARIKNANKKAKISEVIYIPLQLIHMQTY